MLNELDVAKPETLTALSVYKVELRKSFQAVVGIEAESEPPQRERVWLSVTMGSLVLLVAGFAVMVSH